MRELPARRLCPGWAADQVGGVSVSQTPAYAAEPGPPCALLALEGAAGAGRRTLAQRLAALPGVTGVHLAVQTRAVFQELAGRVEGAGKAAIRPPAPLVHAACLVESAVQFEYPENSLAGFELAVADSWVQTWDVYFGDLGEHAEWYLQIASHIPVPDILVYLRVSPAVAAERLLRRSGGGPAAAGGWDETALLPRLTEQCARYDEVMADTDCVVVDADAPASTVFAQVTALVRGAGVGLGIRTD